MLTDELLEQLRYKGEGADLDYKAERYKFAKSTDDEKSDLLKDILAFANSHRDGVAYILMGFKENPPFPADVIGLPSEGAIDDSRIQQFVNEKLETKLEFRYEERLFEEKHIAIISIPKQQRPFYLKKDFGKLTKDTVYVRRGSATGSASLREIVMMGQINSSRGEAKVALIFESSDNTLLPNTFEKVFPVFPDQMPDYERKFNNYMELNMSSLTNKNYWRNLAEYLSFSARAIVMRLVISNESNFSLTDTHLEITCHSTEGNLFSLIDRDHCPVRPDKNKYMDIISTQRIGKDHVLRIDMQGGVPVAHANLGTVLPSQTRRSAFDLVLLPSVHGCFELSVRVFANEIPTPKIITHALKIDGKLIEVDFEKLQEVNL